VSTVSVAARAGHAEARVASSIGAPRATAPGVRAGVLPRCSLHPASLVRPYRTHGPTGPGVYPQCVPGGGYLPHLLSWADAAVQAVDRGDAKLLSLAELDVLRDAADGLTRVETASKRHKGAETVKTQRRSILLKLGARNIAQAVAIMSSEGRC
jgi:DNA-binding CsgD family transcriptional regulator